MQKPVQSDIYVARDVQLVIDLFAPVFEHDWWDEVIIDHLDSMADLTLRAYNNNVVSALVLLKNHFPFNGYQNFEKELTINDTREIVAKDYGFASWKDAKTRGNRKPDTLFELSVDCLIHGQTEDLIDVLQSNRTLLSARSAYGHQSNLLGYVGANGVEIRRQITPLNIVAITEALLKLGADPSETIPVYGKECSVKELIETSAHPHEAGVAGDLLGLLSRFD